jgi:hypothetical protein
MRDWWNRRVDGEIVGTKLVELPPKTPNHSQELYYPSYTTLVPLIE